MAHPNFHPLNDHLNNIKEFISLLKEVDKKSSVFFADETLRYLQNLLGKEECDRLTIAQKLKEEKYQELLKELEEHPKVKQKTMTFKELIEQTPELVKDKTKFEVDTEVLCESLKLDHYCIENWKMIDERLHEVGINTWICTDTRVGLNAIFLDDTLAAFTFQTARKNPIELVWVSKEQALKTKEVLLAAMPDQEKGITVVGPEDRLFSRWIENRKECLNSPINFE